MEEEEEDYIFEDDEKDNDKDIAHSPEAIEVSFSAVTMEEPPEETDNEAEKTDGACRFDELKPSEESGTVKIIKMETNMSYYYYFSSKE